MHQILKMCGKRSVRLKRFLPPVVTAALSADACTGIKREHPHSVSSIVLVISSFFFATKSIRTPIIHHHIQKPLKWSGSSSRLSRLYIRHSACCRSYLYSPFTLRLVISIYLFICKTCKNILLLLKPRRTSVVPENATLSTLLSPCAADGFSSCSTAGDGRI